MATATFNPYQEYNWLKANLPSSHHRTIELGNVGNHPSIALIDAIARSTAAAIDYMIRFQKGNKFGVRFWEDLRGYIEENPSSDLDVMMAIPINPSPYLMEFYGCAEQKGHNISVLMTHASEDVPPEFNEIREDDLDLTNPTDDVIKRRCRWASRYQEHLYFYNTPVPCSYIRNYFTMLDI